MPICRALDLVGLLQAAMYAAVRAQAQAAPASASARRQRDPAARDRPELGHCR